MKSNQVCVIVLSILFVGSASFAQNFEVFRCRGRATANGKVDLDLVAVKQLRDLSTGSFVDHGSFDVTAHLFVSPTTLGALDLSAKTSMQWQRSPRAEGVYDNFAQSQDGSSFASKMLSGSVLAEALQDVVRDPGPLRLSFNGVFLSHYKLKVQHPQVSFLQLTWQSAEFSDSYHVEAFALNGGGAHPLFQFDAKCTREFPEQPPTQ